MMQIPSPETVRRIEDAERDAFLRLYDAAAATCGTLSSSVGEIDIVWSPQDDDPGFNCVLNLADADDPVMVLADIEREARARGIPLLGIDGSPALLDKVSDQTLQGLGYRPDYQEHMWGREVTDDDLVGDTVPWKLDITDVNADDRDTFARVLNVGYDLPPQHVRGHIFASTIGLPNWHHYVVMFDGVPGSASVLYVTQGVADLFVATTMPQYRGQGSQSALIRKRLADGRAAGCDLATSQTVVDNASPRNMARHGFQPLYDRWIYGKTLAPTP